MGPGAERPEGAARGLEWACRGGYFCLGLVAVVVPAILPAVIAAFDLRLSEAALLFPARSVGGLLTAVGAGVLADRADRKAFVLAAALALALCLGGAAVASDWAVVLAAFLVAGLAQAALSTLLNAVVADADPSRRARALNALHGSYSAGALLGPLAFTGLGLSSGAWRGPLAWSAALWTGFGIAAAAVRFPSAAQSAERDPRPRSTGGGAGPLLWALAAVAFIYNGVAWSLLGWIKVFVEMKGEGMDWWSSAMISIFYLGLTTGRFACAHIADRLGHARTILWLAGAAAPLYPLSLLPASPAWIAAGAFTLGLALSGLYPVALAAATARFPQHSGTVTGTLAAAMAAGGMLCPWWTGIIAEIGGMSLALQLNGSLLWVLVGIGVWLVHQEIAVKAVARGR
ncbi:MAG TPA: MFS transporter [Limnochordia bacterium]